MKSLFNHSVPAARKPGINIGGLPSQSIRSTQTAKAVEVIVAEEVVAEDIPAVIEEDVVVETVPAVLVEEVVVETVPVVEEVVPEAVVEVPVKKTRKPRAKKVEDEK